MSITTAFDELVEVARAQERLTSDMLNASAHLAGRYADLAQPYHRVSLDGAIYRVEVLAWFIDNAADPQHPLISTQRERVLLRNGVALHDRRAPEIVDGDVLAQPHARMYVRYPNNTVNFATAKEIMLFLREIPALLRKTRVDMDQATRDLAHDVAQVGALLLNSSRRTGAQFAQHSKAG